MADAPTAPAAGADLGEGEAPAAGVPVVDLTALVRSLYEEADRCRLNIVHLDRLAAVQRRQADLLEQVAAVLSGGHR